MRQLHTEDHEEPTAFASSSADSNTHVESIGKTAETGVDNTSLLIGDLSSAIQKRKRALSWLPLPVITLSAALIGIRTLLFNDVTGIRPVYWALLAAFVAGNTGMMALLFSGIARLNKASRELSSTDDVMAVGVMAEALSVGEPALSIAGSVLIRLLPKMNQNNLEALTGEQRAALRNGLLSASTRRKYTQYNPTLAVAILKTFERLGDEDDHAAVERLTAIRAVTTDQRSIRTAAVNCLAAMNSRLRAESRLVLLRERFSSTEDPTGTIASAASPRSTSNVKSSLTTEETETLSTRLRKLARIRRRNLAITASGAVVGTGLAFVSITNFSHGRPPDSILAAGMLSSLAAMIFFALSGTYSQRNLTNALIHSDDLRIIPPLIQAAATVEVSGTSAVLLLTRLLPMLRSSDTNLLNADDRILLRTAIAKHGRSREFVLAALQALQQIGDPGFVSTVQKIVDRTKNRASESKVHETASECLEFLRQRSALSQANSTLLRASSAAATPNETLLRAVDNAGLIAADELLRTTGAPIVYKVLESDEGQQNLQQFALQAAG